MRHITRILLPAVVPCLVTLLIILTTGTGFCEDPKKLAICPMQMNAAEDLSFLQKGLFSMLSSRLADPGKVEILDRETIDQALEKAQSSSSTAGPLNESKARMIGKELGVDYILFGSLTMFGNSTSLDTSMVDVTGKTPTLTFSRQTDQPGAVITEMDQIAEEINVKTFNRRPEEFVPQAQYAQPAPQYRNEGGSYASPLTNYRVLFSGNGEIIGMSIGDVDGDKKEEVVIAFEHAIEILEDNQDGRLVSVKRIDDVRHMKIVGIDAADINNNGIDEIFITRFHPGEGEGVVRSYVLENSGGAYKDITGNLPWYLRVVKGKDLQPELYGQFSGKRGPYRARRVFQVEWSGSEYVEGMKIRPPEEFNVMSMTRAGHVGDSPAGIVYTDRIGRLNIMKENGTLEWTGEKGYGGSRLYYEFMDLREELGEEAEGRRTFFHPRSLALDVKSDGKPELVAIKNKETAGNLLGQMRNYRSGDIEVLNWSEMGLFSEHAPRKIPGQVTDIAVQDFDKNSKRELFVSFIKKRNNLSSQKSQSMIVAYDLE